METGTAIVVGTVVIVGVIALAYVVTSAPAPQPYYGPQQGGSGNTTSDIASGATSGLIAGLARLFSPSAPSGAGTASGGRDPNTRGTAVVDPNFGAGESVGDWFRGPLA